MLLYIYISQGGRATYLRCGGKRYSSDVVNYLLSLAVKEFLKSPDICQSYE